MKNKKLIFSCLAVLFTAGTGCMLTSCDDWTETEQVDYGITTPDGQNPELYARYAQAVRDYKQREHYMVCVRFDNGHSGEGEKNFLRSMPDSIDAVILENTETLNQADLEDIPVLQRNFDTKILCSFNLTTLKQEAESAGKELKTLLTPALDRMLATISEYGLDGASISYTGDVGLGTDAATNAAIAEMRQLLLDKIAPIAKTGKIFFLESNPLFIPEANRDVFSRYILSTTSAKSASQLSLFIDEAIHYAGVPSDKLLITADPELIVNDNDGKLASQVTFFSTQVIDGGPIGGLLIRNVITDYSHSDATYQETRIAIQTLNPSPLK